ncbi:MAG: SAM-dependent methyltransferase, partial [Myxococcota bacterium]
MAKRATRADLLLVERGLAPSRARAQALIMAGEVFTGDRRVEKAGERLATGAALRVRERPRFVSRGGDKLQAALDAFGPLGLTIREVTALDIGASTGGFTDCLLQAGANRVYAVDVGWGQLHERLRQDARVVVRERTNARHLKRDDFAHPVDHHEIDG